MFVLDDEKPFFVMPICYHPTTVLVVDDERQFLDALELEVSDHLPLLCFDKPEVALEYIKNSRELQIPFAARLHFSGKNDNRHVVLQGCWIALYKILYILALRVYV